jgi:hypothetical protein
MVLPLLLFGLLAGATPDDANIWEKEMNSLLYQYLSCKDPIDDISPCNLFLARSLKTVYGIADFDSPGKNPPCMTANQVATFVSQNPKIWTMLGIATNQETLNSAAGYSKRKKPVIAVLEGHPHGHVALILPGELVKSESWGLYVPNSASFFLNNPKKSYVGEPLSKAFTLKDAADVRIYGRNY